MKYNLAVCGGTFDHLHKGHKEFLRFAISLSQKLLIGLTSDKYALTRNKSEGIESYKIRKQKLERFLKKEKVLERVLIAPIDSIFIPKVWEGLSVEAIVVSENTLPGAKEVNLKRKEQGKFSLNIEIYPMVKSQNNEYISSSKIRKGDLDREGKSYINPEWMRRKLFLGETLRSVLKKPLGLLLSKGFIYETVRVPYVITVGDVTTKVFNALSIGAYISVVDFKVARKRQFKNLKELGFSGREKIFKVKSPAGCLTPALFKAISNIFKSEKTNRRIVLQVEGEEDLSVLPLILAAPLGSVIFYGQPKEGVVKVEVSEKTKHVAYDLVDQFRIGTRGH